ncbi:hypothetical protein BOTBODRAFT_232619, partial [Botryobasidium botryosum FD-172 SS1]
AVFNTTTADQSREARTEPDGATCTRPSNPASGPRSEYSNPSRSTLAGSDLKRSSDAPETHAPLALAGTRAPGELSASSRGRASAEAGIWEPSQGSGGALLFFRARPLRLLCALYRVQPVLRWRPTERPGATRPAWVGIHSSLTVVSVVLETRRDKSRRRMRPRTVLECTLRLAITSPYLGLFGG